MAQTLDELLTQQVARFTDRKGDWDAFADTCLKEYDLRGWTVPDLVNPGKTSVLPPR